jgi:hypothetical protein
MSGTETQAAVFLKVGAAEEANAWACTAEAVVGGGGGFVSREDERGVGVRARVGCERRNRLLYTVK